MVQLYSSRKNRTSIRSLGLSRSFVVSCLGMGTVILKFLFDLRLITTFTSSITTTQDNHHHHHHYDDDVVDHSASVIDSSLSSLPLSSSSFQYELVTTNYGWNSPNNLQFMRRKISRDLWDAIHRHERYNATAWADLQQNPDPTRPLLVFLDIETCIERNWPHYYAKHWHMNVDREHGRTTFKTNDLDQNVCAFLHRALQSPAFTTTATATAHPASRLIYIECDGEVLRPFCYDYYQNNSNDNNNNNKINDGQRIAPAVDIQDHDNYMNYTYTMRQVMFAHNSATQSVVRKNGMDIGNPPPALRSGNLTFAERMEIASCTNQHHHRRKWLFSFRGQLQRGRQGLQYYVKHADKFPNILVQDSASHYKDKISPLTKTDSNNYTDTMRNSIFCLAPRGDNLFSYRFTEAMSLGCIPVVYADDYLLPFHRAVVNWSQIIVMIPESQMNSTHEILQRISPSERCTMQQHTIHVYDAYMSSPDAKLRGYIESALATITTTTTTITPSTHSSF